MTTSAPDSPVAVLGTAHLTRRIAVVLVLLLALTVGAFAAGRITASDSSDRAPAATSTQFSPHEFCHAHVPC